MALKGPRSGPGVAVKEIGAAGANTVVRHWVGAAGARAEHVRGPRSGSVGGR